LMMGNGDGFTEYREDVQKILAAANVRKSRRKFRSKYVDASTYGLISQAT